MKKLTAIALALVLLISLAVPAFAFTAVLSPQKLTVDGKAVACEKYNIDGSNYFKLRDLAQLLNRTGSQFDVGWDEAKKVVSITTDHAYTTPNGHELEVGEDKSATAVVSTQTIMINGVVRSDLAVYNIGGSNFFKLREMGDALGFDVDYDGTTNTAIVLSRGGQQPAPGNDRTELSSEQIYARCMPAVFYIEVYDDYGDPIASGSGFFIDADGTAVTNHHVIYGATSAKVMLTDSSGADREVLDVLGVYDWSEEEDWAVLKIDCTNNSYLKIGDPSTAAGGATVYALGSPLGLSASISDGIISNPARVVDGQTYIQISAPISHGSSGGALVNKYGEVIGITSAGFDDGQNLNLAIPISRIANAKHAGLTPISETYSMPGGNIYTDSTIVTLRPGEYFDVGVTVSKYNTDASLQVSWYYMTGDNYDLLEYSDLISVSFGEWTSNGDQFTNTMRISAKDQFGTTTLVLVLETQDGDFLDVAYLTVTVSGGEITMDTDTLTVDVGSSETIWIRAVTNDSRYKIVQAFVDDKSIASCSWGDWADGNTRVPLTVNGLALGSTYITLKLVDADNNDIILAEAMLYVRVFAGKVIVSEPEIMMAPGESRTVQITGVPNDASVHAVIWTDMFDSDVIDWQRGALGSGTVQLTITALAEGWDCIYITLEDDEGNVLADGWIDVYVTMDGRGEDETVQLVNGAAELAMGQSVYADLNGDGEEELVCLWLDGNGFSSRVRLSIDGKDYTDALYAQVEYIDCPDDSFWAITDIDANDGKLEIAIQDWGPSDDLTTRFLRFDGSALTDLGAVEGFLFYGDGEGDVKVLGGGKIFSYMRLSVMQTWWAFVNYAVGADGKLAPVPQDFYTSVFVDQQTTLLHPVYAHDTPDPFLPSHVLPAGTTAQIVGTDNEQWVKLLPAGGSECWVQLVGYGYQVETPDGLLYTSEVFSDLLMAD